MNTYLSYTYASSRWYWQGQFSEKILYFGWPGREIKIIIKIPYYLYSKSILCAVGGSYPNEAYWQNIIITSLSFVRTVLSVSSIGNSGKREKNLLIIGTSSPSLLVIYPKRFFFLVFYAYYYACVLFLRFVHVRRQRCVFSPSKTTAVVVLCFHRSSGREEEKQKWEKKPDVAKTSR